MTTLTYANESHFPASNWLTVYRTFVYKAEFYRIGWAATALVIQGCLLAPTVLLSMFYFGGGDWQLLAANLCFLVVLVPILSASPVKHVFSAFAVSLAIQLAIILLNVL